jgi:hypothetical protein
MKRYIEFLKEDTYNLMETVVPKTYEMSGPPPKNLWATKAQFQIEMEKIGYTHTTLTKSTSMLICSAEDLGTLKWQKAQKYGIPIFTYEEAFKKFAKKLQRIRNVEIDPYDEEDWGYEEVSESNIGTYRNKIDFKETINNYFHGSENDFIKFMNFHATGKKVIYFKGEKEYGEFTTSEYSIDKKGIKVQMTFKHGYPDALIFLEPIIVNGIDYFYKEEIKEEDIEWF